MVQTTNSRESKSVIIVVAVFATLMSLPMLLNITARLRAETNTRSAVKQMQTQVQSNQTRVDQLQAALEHAKTAAYTERWARTQAHWAQTGEVVVIPPQDAQTQHLWWEEFVSR